MQKILTAALLLTGSTLVAFGQADGDWPTYGHDKGGQRFSPLTQITPDNVATLTPAWTYHMRPQTADMPAGLPSAPRPASAETATPEDLALRRDAAPKGLAPSEMTPLVVGGLMYITTPYKTVAAIEPETGKQVWSYTLDPAGQPSLRGVEYWPGNKTSPARILFGTRDGRLIALDARSGKPVSAFGQGGTLNLRTPDVMGDYPDAGYGLTSPPLVTKDLVVTGVANQEFPALGAYGDIRAWDVQTGKLAWTFHTIPRPGEPGHETWEGDSWKGRSGVNAWGFMTADESLGLVYAPLGAPSTDRYGGDRKGDNLYSSSIVALDAKTGKLRWYYQLVHHDIFDFDLESAPLLMTITHGGQKIPALAILSKAGQVIFLDRRTGKPIYPVKEVPVPQSHVPGEVAAATQPMPVTPIPIMRQTMTPGEITDITPELKDFCTGLVADNHIQLGGPYLPAGSNQYVVNFPGTIGMWGGGSFNPQLGYIFVNTHDLGQIQSLVPRSGPVPFAQDKLAGRFWNPAGHLPCQQTPWGRLSAIDVNKGAIAWQVPLGSTDSMPEGKRETGRPGLGGSIATAGGLVFVGATDDGYFRAFDARSGKRLWTVKLDAAAHATPSTYLGRDGKQYVVITATGGGFLQSPLTGDSVTAYRLP
jgi:quinoprotein glucose dehydrogenase